MLLVRDGAERLTVRLRKASISLTHQLRAATQYHVLDAMRKEDARNGEELS